MEKKPRKNKKPILKKSESRAGGSSHHSPDDLRKQQLKDLEQMLNMDLGSFLVLNEEGTKDQVEKAKQKVRSDLLKHGADMEKLAQGIGPEYAELVGKFIKSIQGLLDSFPTAMDPAKLSEHHKITTFLEHLVKLREKGSL